VIEIKFFIAEKVTRLDLMVWTLVLFFFCGAALYADGNLELSFLGASGIIVVMFLIGSSIEMIIECMKNVRGLGTLVGFITNGPEMICLLVGLFITQDVLFAASTPLGSNFMNPVLLFIAALLTKSVVKLMKTNPVYSVCTILSTATMAVVFYAIPESLYWLWVVGTASVSVGLFVLRPKESTDEDVGTEPVAFGRVWLIPAVIMLLVAGYFLDPTVQFTATHSKAPAGVIGFLVLSTLTSWPEFKSALSLLRRGMVISAILNITVSNITNLWLAVGGVVYYLAAR
jgi:cation:H+ antiporter